VYGELGYAAAYVHLSYVLSCVERYVDWFPFRLEGVCKLVGLFYNDYYVTFSGLTFRLDNALKENIISK
jgi:hypothetical protein